MGTDQPEERPLLLSDTDVRAILAGTKTMFRRVVEADALRVRLPYEVRSDLRHLFPCSAVTASPGEHNAELHDAGAVSVVLGDGKKLGVRPGEFDFVCPWIGRATTRIHQGKWCLEPVEPVHLWGRESIRFHKADDAWSYLADLTRVEGIDPPEPKGWMRRSPIGMPRAACRIVLRPIAVRIERLQEITNFDAIHEVERRPSVVDRGIHVYACGRRGRGDPRGRLFRARALDAFREQWDHRIRTRAWKWSANPWVWVVHFERVFVDDGVRLAGGVR